MARTVARYVAPYRSLPAVPWSAGREDLTPHYFRDRSTNQLIVGGVESEAHKWPWQVFLISGNMTADGGLEGTSCGGVLVAQDWVLTAAHCVMTEYGKPYEVSYVYAGSNQIEAGEQIRAYRVAVHENYDDVMIENDIALLQLEHAAGSGAEVIAFADLDTEAQYAANGSAAIATGWGALRDGEFLTSGKAEANDVPTYLREVQLEVLDLATCRTRPGGYEVSENMLCAAAPGKIWRGTCSGDSGGPLVVEAPDQGGYILVGISSWVRVCGDPQYYSVFTRVSRYTDWINETIKRFQ
jgi:secreted trypsin-like serine protease